MGAGVPQKKINEYIRRMKKKNPGVEYRVLRASNGEVAILPIKPVEHVRTHADDDIENFNNGYRDGRPDDRDGSGQ